MLYYLIVFRFIFFPARMYGMVGGGTAAGDVGRWPHDPNARREVRGSDGRPVRDARLPEVSQPF